MNFSLQDTATHPSTPRAPVPRGVAQNSSIRTKELNSVSCSIICTPLAPFHLHTDGPHMSASRAIVVAGPARDMKRITHIRVKVQ